MEQQKDIIYIPYWIAGMLERHNLPLSDVLDYSKMSPLLSLQEQANMLMFQELQPFDSKAVNSKTGETVRLPVFEKTTRQNTNITRTEPFYRLGSRWQEGMKLSGGANNSALILAFENARQLSYSDATKDEVLARFDPANAGPLKRQEPFVTYDLDRSAAIVVVYPKFFDCDVYESNVAALLKAVLKVLYAYNTHASVCATPYFRKYLETLA